MNLFYIEEHLSCGHYISDYSIGFQHRKLEKGEFFISSNKLCNCLIFILKGEASFLIEGKTFELKKNAIGFIPISAKYQIEAQTDMEILINYFNKHIDLCEKLALENLTSYLAGDKKKNISPILKIKSPMKSFLSSLTFYLGEGISCKHFHEMKQKEMFFLLRFFYTKEEVASLFAPIISKDLDFRDLVLSNYMQANSVKTLARICNYSLSTFNRIFKYSFDENPYIWLQNQKMKYITEKLSNKNIPLGQIIDEFGFSSPAHFTVFCKKHLNKTPSQFRKERS